MPDLILPQPPPDAPAPPPGEEALRSRWKMRWVMIVGIACVIFLPLRIGVIRNGAKSAKETEHNIRQLGMALREFDTYYGKFPDSSTYQLAWESTASTLDFGAGSSNDIFKQLFIAEIALSERMFYANVKSARRPDNIFNRNATALEHGECAFAYIYGLSSKDAADTPLIFGPVSPVTHDFDLSANHGKVLVITVDNSMKTYALNSAGKIILPNGLDFFEPSQPFWHGKTPDVKWPK